MIAVNMVGVSKATTRTEVDLSSSLPARLKFMFDVI